MSEINKEEMRDRLGNIAQIRDLLFGTQIREYEKQFQKIELELSNLFSFKEEINNKFTQLQTSLSQDINAAVDSLEKKLKYLSLTTHEEINKLTQEQTNLDKKVFNDLDNLNQAISSQGKQLKQELAKTNETIEANVNNLKQSLLEDLEKYVTKLQETKVSRDDLAEVLFELCLKVKGTDFVPDLQEAADSKTDFLLPEREGN